MLLTRDDLEFYECPDCTKLGSYRLDWPEADKPAVYKCYVCGREINERWLEREIQKKG
jgi:hypothetical protein